ncbi:hypothetical protein BBL07_23760 [Agrobacterium vitis]|nr:hypothetical protein BBL07_23760 [Agrobacterium vitis]
MPPYPAAKQHAQSDIEGRESKAFGHADLFAVLMQNTKIENEEEKNDCKEEKPHPCWLAHKINPKKIHKGIPLPEGFCCSSDITGIRHSRQRGPELLIIA